MNSTWIRRSLSAVTLTLMAFMVSAGASAQTLKSLTLSPTTVLGGHPAHGRAEITAAAPTGGLTITLASDSTFATVPASVSIPAGATGADFEITTTAVTTNLTATIAATDPSSNSLTAKLNVNAPVVVALKSVAISPSQVVDGNGANGDVELNAAAPTGGFVVSLSFDQTFAQAPATVTVPAGARHVGFAITTTAGQTGSTTLTATDSANDSATAKLSVVNLALAGVELSPAKIAAGKVAHGQVRLNGEAPTGGYVVNLSSDQTFAQTPASVTVAAGKRTADFSITTTADSSGTAKISASDGTSTFSASLDVFIFTLDVKSVDTGNFAHVGGSTFKGCVYLNGKAPTGGFVVNLASDNSDLTAPASVTVPAGQSAVVFSLASTKVTAKTVVTLTATDANNASASTKVTLVPFELRAFGTLPNRVVGGRDAWGSLLLTGPAPTGGFTLSLSSSSTSAVVPATVTIPAKKSLYSFKITTTAVTQVTKVTLTATDANGVVTTTVLEIDPVRTP